MYIQKRIKLLRSIQPIHFQTKSKVSGSLAQETRNCIDICIQRYNRIHYNLYNILQINFKYTILNTLMHNILLAS